MTQDAFKVAFHHPSHLHHRLQQLMAGLFGLVVHPTTPALQIPFRLLGIGRLVVDVLENQAHLVSPAPSSNASNPFGPDVRFLALYASRGSCGKSTGSWPRRPP